jgi:ABC-type glutathione transport system ATPase component
LQEIFRILRTVNCNEGVGMLLVEQNANIALELADQAYLMETGCVVMGGPAAIAGVHAHGRRPSELATLFQSVNSAGTEVTGRALNRYNA